MYRHTGNGLHISPGDGLHISTLLTVRSCIIMYCTYMYVFSVNKILFKPNLQKLMDSLLVQAYKLAKGNGTSPCTGIQTR